MRTASPGDWYYNNDSNPGGQRSCGTYNGQPDMFYTRNADLMLGNIFSNDMNSLYQWWQNYG